MASTKRTMPDRFRYFIAPAGSNVAYIGLIITGVDVSSCLSYHAIYENSDAVHFNWVHDLDKKLNDNDTKVYFDDMREIIPLNWYTKFVLEPALPKDKKFGIDWVNAQSEAWKASHGSEWMTMAALRWFGNIYKENLGLGNLDEKRHFDGTCLYKGHKISQSQFEKFGVTYNKEQYDQWYDSQKQVIDMIAEINNCDSMAKVHSMNDDFCRGIALGVLARKMSITEETAWQQYIK